MSLLGARKPPARRRLRAAARRGDPVRRCPNVFALPEYEKLWLIYRSSDFDEIDGVEVPVFTYRQIAASFTRNRRFRLSEAQVWRFLHREAPELAARRSDPYPFAWKDRRKGL